MSYVNIKGIDQPVCLHCPIRAFSIPSIILLYPLILKVGNEDPDPPVPMCRPGFKFNFFDSLLKLASSIIFYLLNLSANLLFHAYKHY